MPLLLLLLLPHPSTAAQEPAAEEVDTAMLGVAVAVLVILVGYVYSRMQAAAKPTAEKGAAAAAYNTKHTTINAPGKTIVLISGRSGSGKSSLANALVARSHNGVCISQDHYFTRSFLACVTSLTLP